PGGQPRRDRPRPGRLRAQSARRVAFAQSTAAGMLIPAAALLIRDASPQSFSGLVARVHAVAGLAAEIHVLATAAGTLAARVPAHVRMLAHVRVLLVLHGLHQAVDLGRA